MAYETGSASSPNDLLDKLRAFLLSNGWSINSFAVIGSGRRLHAARNGIFVNFRSYQNENLSGANDVNNESTSGFWGIGGNPSDGYSGANLWCQQPGYPNYGGAKGGYMNQLSSAIPAYHFFTYADIDEVHVVVEFVTGRFQYMGFGLLDRYNTSASGGRWMSMPTNTIAQLPSTFGIDYSGGGGSMVPFRASHYTSTVSTCSSFIRVNIDNHDGWAGEGNGVGTSPSPIVAVGPHHYWFDMEVATVSPYTWQTQMFPYMIGISRSGAAVSPFGEIKHLRELDITNYLPGEEFSLGPDTWKVFPLYQKAGYSLTRGFAVRKVA